MVRCGAMGTSSEVNSAPSSSPWASSAAATRAGAALAADGTRSAADRVGQRDP